MTDSRRYPLEPLAAILGLELGRIGGSQPHQPAAGLAALAQHLGISHRMAFKLNREGLNDRQADKYAIAIGHHPSHIWPEWWDIDELALEREARHPSLDDALDDLTDNLDDDGGRYDLAF